MERSDIDRIENIIKNYEQLLKALKDLKKTNSPTFSGYINNSIKHNIVLIGEHFSNLPTYIKSYIGYENCNRLIKARNFLIHEYKKPSDKLLFDCINEELPKIFERVLEIKKKNFVI